MKCSYQDAPEELFARAQAIAQLCEQHTPGRSNRLPLHHRAVVNVTLGMGSAHHERRNAELFKRLASAALSADLREAGLLREDVPLPCEPVPGQPNLDPKPDASDEVSCRRRRST